MDPIELDFSTTAEQWCAGYLVEKKAVILRPESDESTSPMLACVEVAGGQMVCLEAFIDDETGHILIDFGLETVENEGGQGGERPTGEDLDRRSAPVKLILRSDPTQEGAGPAERRAPCCPYCGSLSITAPKKFTGISTWLCKNCLHRFDAPEWLVWPDLPDTQPTRQDGEDHA